MALKHMPSLNKKNNLRCFFIKNTFCLIFIPLYYDPSPFPRSFAANKKLNGAHF